VLALLLLRANEPVDRDELIDRLWGEDPPPTAKAALHNAVSALRKALGEKAIETVGTGYRMRVARNELDALRFETLVAEARGANAEVRSERLGEALAEWRGHPLSDYAFAEAEIVRLEEVHLVALEERFDAELELGRAAELVPELQALAATYPLRERFWAQLMLSLYRSGRPAEALATYRRAHTAFVDELGLEPGATLRELQRAILLQDTALFELHRGSDLIERAANFLPTSEAGRAEALYDYGLALWRTGERARAKSALVECERRADAIGHRTLAHRARALRAGHAAQAGEITAREFERIASEAVEASRAEGDLVALADALLAHGHALREVGLADRAVACHREGIELTLDIGDRWREGIARSMLGLVLMLGTTPVADAVAECEHHLEALEWGSPGPVGLWMALGMLYTQAGRTSDGQRCLADTGEALRSVGAASTLSAVEIFRSWAALIAGDRPRAVAHARTALELIDSLADEGAHGDVAALLARLEAESDRVEEAELLLVPARPLLEQNGGLFLHVSLRRAEAAIARARKDGQKAAKALRDGCARAAASDFLTLYAETLEDAGELEVALAAFERKGDVVSAARVREQIPSRA
jgi:DNA-binding SARP family transcriptional activator